MDKKFVAKHHKFIKNAPVFTGANIILATEAADPAENLPDGIATCVAVGITREEKHLADLLFRICLARTNAL